MSYICSLCYNMYLCTLASPFSSWKQIFWQAALLLRGLPQQRLKYPEVGPQQRHFLQHARSDLNYNVNILFYLIVWSKILRVKR